MTHEKLALGRCPSCPAGYVRRKTHPCRSEGTCRLHTRVTPGKSTVDPGSAVTHGSQWYIAPVTSAGMGALLLFTNIVTHHLIRSEASKPGEDPPLARLLGLQVAVI